MRTAWLGLALIGALVASGCARDPDAVPNLLTVRPTDNSPDEFAIVPNKPLEAPESYAELPAPTPGGANRADQTPIGDAVAALGGRPGAGPGGVPARDAGLVRYAARGGTAAGIRETLAAEDLAFRQRSFRRPLERLFGVSTYFRVYEGQSLDQHRELDRWRAAGVRTPSAPPDPER